MIIAWGVLTITFFIIHLAPGDPTSLYIRPDIDPETISNIRRQMGLDQALWQQYLLWLKQFASGNFGISFVHNRPVTDILGEAIPNTLQLTGTVFLLQLILGINLGVLMALKYGSRTDKAINAILLFFYSVPGFWLALMAIMVFSLRLMWLPSSQMQSLSLEGQGLVLFWDRLRHLVLPAAVLSIPFSAYTARFVRSSLVDVLQQDYIRTARAYGLRPARLLFKYALRNALLPTITLLGLYLPFLLGGAVITEQIFAWPGIGKLTINAVFTHDFPLILASTFITAMAVVIGNQISDMLYALIDPRIRLLNEQG